MQATLVEHDVQTQVPVEEIEGLVRTETHTLPEFMAAANAKYKETLTHEEVYGEFVTLTRHIPVPQDYVFDYLSTIRAIEEFTISLRNFRPCPGREGLWVGEEYFRPDTRIYLRIDADRETGCIDHPCAWNNSEDLWMFYAFRLYDGSRVMNKPGTVVQWTNFHHTNYDEGGPFFELIKAFPKFNEIHDVELDNLERILTTRFRNEYGYLLDEQLPGSAPAA